MPNGGNLVVLFSPHVGCTPEGDFGKFSRDGQDFNDHACGAAIAAYKWLENNEWEPIHEKLVRVKIPTETDAFDYQFVYIREALKPYFK